MQVDLALDFLGQAETPEVTLACLASLKRGGILVLYGSMLCPLPLNYGVCQDVNYGTVPCPAGMHA